MAFLVIDQMTIKIAKTNRLELELVSKSEPASSKKIVVAGIRNADAECRPNLELLLQHRLHQPQLRHLDYFIC
jgi:hypothetical protein